MEVLLLMYGLLTLSFSKGGDGFCNISGALLRPKVAERSTTVKEIW